MNDVAMKTLIDETLLFVSRWAGVTIPRALSALAGLFVIVLALMGFWERRIKIAGAILFLASGVFLVAIAADTRILDFFAQTSYVDRIRFLLALFSVLVMAITFESIRISRLRERYAMLWMATSGLIFVASLFPDLVHFLTALLGVQYVTAVVLALFIFLLLVVFHFSIVLSGLEVDWAKIAQRCALLDLRLERVETKMGIFQPLNAIPKTTARSSKSHETSPAAIARSLRGAEAATLAVIGLAFVSTLLVGFNTNYPMIGDEVTHYFMLRKQSVLWPTPSFTADIPNSWSDQPEVRYYPHPNGWHYVGGMIDHYWGGSFYVVQFYQGLFWLQLLLVAFMWSRSRGGDKNRSMLLYIIVLASVPMNLLFSVSFYQDIPMAAQALTAFYLMDRRRYIWATLFMVLAIWIKVTGVIFAFPFFVLGFYRLWQDHRWNAVGRRKVILLMFIMTACTGGMVYANGWILEKYARSPYYPTQKIERIIKALKKPAVTSANTAVSKTQSSYPSNVRPVTAYEMEIIANHPGDLRNPANFFVFGGVLIWFVLVGGVAGLVRPRSEKIQPGASRRQSWPMMVGLFYIVITYVQLRSAPDARFFLPALPFVALSLCEWSMRLPWTRLILISAAVVGLLQGDQVLRKTYKLRQVDPDIEQAISFLRENPPEPKRIFMYPEGNYRLFPVPHDWYLSYRLREFWRGDNDFRIQLLNQKRIGAIVVKKHLVATIDLEMNNLGIYPPEFVADLRNDARFEKTFENEGVVIFNIPATNPK